MRSDDGVLRKILAIGHDTSLRGEGLSLRDALVRARYREVRTSFGAQDLLSLLRAEPELVQQWILYSEDKRTSGGWYLLSESREVGRVGAPRKDRLHFHSLEEAVAEYVVRELDFWSAIGRPTGDGGGPPERK